MEKKFESKLQLNSESLLFNVYIMQQKNNRNHKKISFNKKAERNGTKKHELGKRGEFIQQTKNKMAKEK
jgi:hypothetical protein